jgi:hypothetical protein
MKLICDKVNNESRQVISHLYTGVEGCLRNRMLLRSYHKSGNYKHSKENYGNQFLILCHLTYSNAHLGCTCNASYLWLDLR